MTKKKRIILTPDEIEAVLAVAGAADAPAVFEDFPPDERAVIEPAFDRGMSKLRNILDGKRRQNP